MNKWMKALTALTVAGLIGATGAVYAAAAKTPAEVVSELTGKSVEELTEERDAGKSYGRIAYEAGKLEEFKAGMLEQRKAILDQRVKEGKLTQAQADDILNKIKERHALCDGTGDPGIGAHRGKALGRGMKNGEGMGMGRGVNR